MPGVSSKCAHFAAAHVNYDIYDLFIPGPSVKTALTKRGPA